MKKTKKRELSKKVEKSPKMTKKQAEKMRHFDVLNMCSEIRRQANKWTNEQREEYFKIGMRLINGEKQ